MWKIMFINGTHERMTARNANNIFLKYFSLTTLTLRQQFRSLTSIAGKLKSVFVTFEVSVIFALTSEAQSRQIGKRKNRNNMTKTSYII